MGRMLRPKIGTRCLREPVQSKCARTSHKSHPMRELPGKNSCAKIGTHSLRELAQSKCAWTCHKSHPMRRFNLYQPAQTTCTGICYRSPCMREFTGKMPRHKIGTRSLCEPAQSKCTWTCPKSHCRKNAAPDKLAARFAQVCAVDMHWDSAQEQFHNGIYCKNCREQMEPPDPTPALTPAVRTRQCRHTAEGQRERRHEPPQFTTLIANVWRIGNRKASKCCRLVLPQARKQCVFSFLQRTQFTYTNYQTTVLYGAFRFDQYLPR